MGDSKEASSASAPDLDDLLDSALTDFDKPLPKVETINLASDKVKVGDKLAAGDGNLTEDSQWGDEFEKFQSVMESFLKDSSLPTVNAADLASGSGDLSSSLAETLKTLADKAQNITESSPDDITQLLKSMGLNDMEGLQNDQLPDFMPMMQNVMQNLLSKELLYPSLKDITSKYPDWLAEKQPVLEEAEFRKYSKQYDIMKEVCEEFENANYTTDEAKAKSFEKILTLMQQMQDCGNPPKDLVGDLPADLPFDVEGNPLSNMQEQCTLM